MAHTNIQIVIGGAISKRWKPKGDMEVMSPVSHAIQHVSTSLGIDTTMPTLTT